MRFSSPISCITPLDARQESGPTGRRGEEEPWAKSLLFGSDVRPPRTKAETSLERLPTAPCVPAHERVTAHGSQEAVDRARHARAPQRRHSSFWAACKLGAVRIPRTDREGCPIEMADYWQQKDTSRPEDEWQLPLDHPDNPDNPESQGNKLKAATQALSDRLAQEKHSLGKRDELMVFTYQGDLERVRFVLKAERAPDINMRDFGGYNLGGAGRGGRPRRYFEGGGFCGRVHRQCGLPRPRADPPRRATRPRRVRARTGTKKGIIGCAGPEHGPDGLASGV